MWGEMYDYDTVLISAFASSAFSLASRVGIKDRWINIVFISFISYLSASHLFPFQHLYISILSILSCHL